jgi:hypothetical protein
MQYAKTLRWASSNEPGGSISGHGSPSKGGTMSAGTARAVSTGLLGGIMAVVLFSQGLVVWAAFVAWALFLASGGGGQGLKSTVANSLIGAFIGWITLVLITVVFRVADGTWMWMPRTGIIIGLAVAGVSLTAKGDSTKIALPRLCGFAVLLGAAAGAVPAWVTDRPLTALRLHNPGIAAALSLVGGALFAYAAEALSAKLVKS